MKRIAVLDDYQDAALQSADWSLIEGAADITVFRDHIEDRDALIERLLPFDALCVMRERTPLNAEILTKLPNLKFIASPGQKNASIDLRAAAENNILVSFTAGRGNGAPELTWALIMASARHLTTEQLSVRRGGWQTTVGSDLEGHTLGILGLGKIGARVAAVGRAFGMNVIAWSPNLTDEHAKAANVTLVSKEALLRESDWLSLHLVLSARSKGIIGASEIASMKSTAWIVNTSRGPLVDEPALIDALRRRAIAGAALDVFDVEPLPANHPLRQLDNVIAMPHVGFVTKDTYAVFFGQMVENIAAWLHGTPIRLASTDL